MNIELNKILSNDTKKTTKIKAFDTLMNAINVSNIEMSEEIASALKTIYPTTSAKNTDDYWKLLQKFAGKKDVRYYLNGIYVKDEKTLVASNGHVLCIVEFNDVEKSHGLKVGALYEKQNEKIIVENMESCKYPEFTKSFKNKYKDITIDFDAIHSGYDSKITGLSGKVTYYNKINDTFFDNEYLKLIPKNIHSAHFCNKHTDDVGDGCLLLEIINPEYTAKLIIMPARI